MGRGIKKKQQQQQCYSIYDDYFSIERQWQLFLLHWKEGQRCFRGERYLGAGICLPQYLLDE